MLENTRRPVPRLTVRGTVVIALTLLLLGAVAQQALAATGDVYAGAGQGKIKVFSPTGTLIKTLDSGINSGYTTGMAFDSQGNVYATLFNSGAAKWLAGSLTGAAFGSGFNLDPESVTIDASDNIYIGQADGTHSILKFSTAGASLGSFTPTVGPRGTDWIDLASDQCTMYYTSEGNTVRRYNVCTSTQLADFATGLPAPCYALRVRLNGEVMVGCAANVVRLSSTGTVLGTYPGSGFTPPTSNLFALNLDPDGATFWTGNLDSTGQVYRVNISTGAQVTSFPTNVFSQMAGLAVEGEIRASQPTPTPSGTPQPAEEIPVASGKGLIIFAALIALGAALLISRRVS